jgi:hypothetical protein
LILDRVNASLPVDLWGRSYGGFLTAMGLARNSDMFKTGVDFHGVHDWVALESPILAGHVVNDSCANLRRGGDQNSF